MKSHWLYFLLSASLAAFLAALYPVPPVPLENDSDAVSGMCGPPAPFWLEVDEDDSITVRF